MNCDVFDTRTKQELIQVDLAVVPRKGESFHVHPNNRSLYVVDHVHQVVQPLKASIETSCQVQLFCTVVPVVWMHSKDHDIKTLLIYDSEAQPREGQ